MLWHAYYPSNYAGIIGAGLATVNANTIRAVHSLITYMHAQMKQIF